MGKKIFILAAVAAVFAACEAPYIAPEPSEDETTGGKRFTFTLKGDFSDEWAPTRAYLQSDGRDLTDVWVLDYVGGSLVQQVHQSDNTAEDFGKPQLTLAQGSHHIYFIASRGASPTLNTEDHVISFAKVYDTFYKDYEVTVVPTSNGNRAVTLDRVVTRLKLTVTDALPAGAASYVITPTSWYYGWDYIAGAPSAATSSQAFVIPIPADKIGTSPTTANIYGFSGATEWATDVAFACKKSDDSSIGAVALSGIKFRANRSTDYSGPLFSSGGTLDMSLNTEWLESESGSW